MTKKKKIIIFFIIIIIVGLVLVKKYIKKAYYTDPLFCIKKTDCTFQKKECYCGCSTDPVNIYNVKKMNCPPNPNNYMCDVVCPRGELKCLMGQCVFVKKN